MPSENIFLYTKDDVVNLNGSILHGYAVTDSSIIINTEGLRKYECEKKIKIPEEGRFAGIFSLGEKKIIKSDMTGQEIIYLFTYGDDWAVSNSFMLLATYASKRRQLTFYQPAALNFLLKNGRHVGEQLLSHKTMIEQIKILPFNHEMHVCNKTGSFSVVKKDFEGLFKANTDYESTIIHTLSKGRAILDALNIAGMPIYLSLSGGYDSRIVLGMLSKEAIDTGNVYIRTDVNRHDDFTIVSEIAKHRNLQINNVKSPRKLNSLSPSESLRYFMLSCGGTYLPIYPLWSNRIPNSHLLRLTGDQNVDASYFHGKALFNGAMEKVGNDIGEALKNKRNGFLVKEDFENTFDEIGVDINSPLSSVAYYYAIRARHHCGRNWYKSIASDVLITPLMTKEFNSLIVDTYSKDLSEDKFFADLFSAIGSWATDIPFCSAKGNLSSDLVSSSKFRGGVDLVKINYKVYGRFSGLGNEKVCGHDLPIDFSMSVDLFKKELLDTFHKINMDKHQDVFGRQELQLASQEIANSGNLSHGYRTVTHMLYVDLVKKITSR